jgi:phosphoribosylanthranilate isomerase
MEKSLDMQVKICCISSLEEAKLAIQSGATDIGLLGKMPSGPGIISDELIAQISKRISPNNSTWLLTSEIESKKIIAQHKKTNTTTIQIVYKIKYANYCEIRNALPDIKIAQVVHILGDDSIEEAKRVSEFVDYLLLDSGNPNLPIKQLGGTGKTHNWSISKRICQEVNVPVYLAGGLNSKNINGAIEYVKPYGVDLCSGVRTDQKLDETKLIEFFSKVKSGK